MTKRIYLHIGWEKTGSSSIQTFCARNQKWLNDRNVHYPLMGRVPQHVELFFDLYAGYAQRIDRSKRAIQAEIRSCEQDKLIFSHESLHSCKPSIIADVFEGCDVRIVAYIRRPDAAFVSFFVTSIRYGLKPEDTLFKWMRAYTRQNLEHFDYYWALMDFVTQFGRDAVTVRHYHPEEMVGGQTVTDFMHLLGVDDLSESKWPEARSNLSLDADQFALALAFLKTYAGAPAHESAAAVHHICNIMLKSSKSKPNPSRSVQMFVPHKLNQRLRTAWELSFDRLYNEFFESLRVFDLSDSTTDSQPYTGIPHARAQELQHVFQNAPSLPTSQLNTINRLIPQLTDRSTISENQNQSPPT